MSRRYGLVLTLLALLFLGRVLGQALVAFLAVGWLPPMPEWYSGLLPYPLLLPAQLVILVVQAWAARDLWRGRGFFAVPRPRAGRVLVAFALVYFMGMVVRYALTMTWHPERRWLGIGTIPIVFHWVLAGWLFTLGWYQRRRGSA